jgi:L-alanine-DL-glutamate epimerase-like enolase superfamily enzyme
MRLRRVEIIESEGDVEGPRSAVGRWNARAGLLLRVEAPNGHIAFGEASPLPGYSLDTLGEAREALGAIDWDSVPDADDGEPVLEYLNRVSGTPLVPATQRHPRAPQTGSGNSPITSGAARFALETVLLDLLAQKRGVPLYGLLSEGDVSPVPLCFMVGGADDATVVDAAKRAADQGAHTIKVKVTGPSFSDQLGILERVRKAIGPAMLRLDANQTLTDETVGSELARLAAFTPEFVEEPAPAEAMLRLADPAVPVALDESLLNEALWNTVRPSLASLRCVALVLKPMTLGGFSACLWWASRARDLGLDVAVSHAFDGPVALAASAHLALAVSTRTRGSGLSRHGGLGAWPAMDVPLIGRTEVVPTSIPGLGVAPFAS